MLAYIVPLFIFFIALSLAAFYDATSLRIPNFIPLAMVLGFLLSISLNSPELNQLANHVAVGLGVLVISFGLFAFRVIGGGDGKLLAAGALWFQWGMPVMTYALNVVLAGGVMCILILLFRNQPLPLTLHKIEWLDRLHQKDQGIPYGIAIALGGISAYPQSAFYIGF